jgi:hypothetical protein
MTNNDAKMSINGTEYLHPIGLDSPPESFSFLERISFWETVRLRAKDQEAKSHLESLWARVDVRTNARNARKNGATIRAIMLALGTTDMRRASKLTKDN